MYIYIYMFFCCFWNFHVERLFFRFWDPGGLWKASLILVGLVVILLRLPRIEGALIGCTDGFGCCLLRLTGRDGGCRGCQAGPSRTEIIEIWSYMLQGDLGRFGNLIIRGSHLGLMFGCENSWKSILRLVSSLGLSNWLSQHDSRGSVEWICDLQNAQEAKRNERSWSPWRVHKKPWRVHLCCWKSCLEQLRWWLSKKDDVPFCNSNYHPCSHQKELILNHSLITSMTLNRTKAFEDEIKKEKPDQWLNENWFRFKIS